MTNVFHETAERTKGRCCRALSTRVTVKNPLALESCPFQTEKQRFLHVPTPPPPETRLYFYALKDILPNVDHSSLRPRLILPRLPWSRLCLPALAGGRTWISADSRRGASIPVASIPGGTIALHLPASSPAVVRVIGVSVSESGLWRLLLSNAISPEKNRSTNEGEHKKSLWGRGRGREKAAKREVNVTDTNHSETSAGEVIHQTRTGGRGSNSMPIVLDRQPTCAMHRPSNPCVRPGE